MNHHTESDVVLKYPIQASEEEEEERNEIAEISDVFRNDLELGAVGGEYRADGAAPVFLREHSERSGSTNDRSSGRSFYRLSTDSGRESLFSHTAGSIEEVEDDFYCVESEQFWNSITSEKHEITTWHSFRKKLASTFPADTLAKTEHNNKVLNFVKTLLDVKDKRDVVHVDSYCKMLRFFGPFKADDSGKCICLHQLDKLIKKSSCRTASRSVEVISWFAGEMSKEDANNKLQGQNPETFLVRMSESEAHLGNFVISVVVQKDEAPVHFIIQGHPHDAAASNPFHSNLEHMDVRYPSLSDLIRRHIGEPVSEEYRDIFLTKPCPGLPLNGVFTGYSSARRPQRCIRQPTEDTLPSS